MANTLKKVRMFFKTCSPYFSNCKFSINFWTKVFSYYDSSILKQLIAILKVDKLKISELIDFS